MKDYLETECVEKIKKDACYRFSTRLIDKRILKKTRKAGSKQFGSADSCRGTKTDSGKRNKGTEMDGFAGKS